MSSYQFAVREIVAEPYAASPQLTARLQITETTGQVVHAIVLRCQVRIEAQRRGYTEQDEIGLRALFGDRERWRSTLKPFLWMQCSATVPGFTGSVEVDLPMPCTYDFEVVGSRYLHALGAGTVPLSLLFSGTVFLRGERGFGVEQVPWTCEASYGLPVTVWRDLIGFYYPSTGWLRLDHDSLEALADYRARHGLISWEETMSRLLSLDREVLR